MTDIFVSVLIPTHNRRAIVLRAVSALLMQDYPRNLYEVIVVCDRCVDGTEEALATHFGSQIKVVAAAEHGPGGAINTGMSQARGEIAIFMDDELEASPCLISEYVLAHCRGVEKKVAVVGFVSIPVASNADPVVSYIAAAYQQFFHQLADPSHENSPSDVSGSNFSLKTADFREVGGFNQSYPFARNDFELGIRLLQNGFTFRFAPAAAGVLQLAITGRDLVNRAETWARADCSLARQYPSCIRHLPVFTSIRKARTRAIWRLVWLVGRPCAAILGALHKAVPNNLRWMRWEYAVRYALGVRGAVSSWRELQQLCGRA